MHSITNPVFPCLSPLRLLRIPRVGGVARLLWWVALGGRGSVLGLGVALGRSTVGRLVVRLLGVGWVSGRVLIGWLGWGLLVGVVGVVSSRQGRVGLVGERHGGGGVCRVGQRPGSSSVRVTWSWSSCRGRGGRAHTRAGRGRSGGGGILTGRPGGVMVGRSLGWRVQGHAGEGGGEVLQQLLLLRLPGEAEIRNFALKEII